MLTVPLSSALISGRQVASAVLILSVNKPELGDDRRVERIAVHDFAPGIYRQRAGLDVARITSLSGALTRIGLVNRVLPADALMPWALETADTIAANSPSAVQAVKEQISATIADHARSREVLEQTLGDRVRASDHFTEGIRAFLEKRPPNYR